jgi:acetyltransferase-like isoleucine patch superfamily enzyme
MLDKLVDAILRADVMTLAKLYRIAAKAPNMLRRQVRSWLWARILDCPGLQVGDGALIIGDHRMRVGTGFRAGRMLWMEAVTKYGQQALTPTLHIGERLSASDGVHIACAFKVTIGNDVLIGSKVHITDHNHGNYDGPASSLPIEAPATRSLTGSSVYIGNRVFLSDGVVVLPGSYIEDGVIVGANSVVNGNLKRNTICVGAPAKPLKKFDNEKKEWIKINLMKQKLFSEAHEQIKSEMIDKFC